MTKDEITIYFDMDGVLANMKGFMDAHDIEYNPDNVRDKAVDKIMWDKLNAIDHFYDKFDPLEGSVELFQKLSETYRCEVLSAIPKPDWGVLTAGEDKRSWVKRILGEDVVVHIVYRAEKQEFVKGPQSVLVDDLAINIREWEANGGTGILFTSAAEFDYKKLEELVEA